MGVPTFYRWLTAKYPRVVRDAVEEYSELTPVDVAGPNPSGIEIDNFYIDMNGVVHPCAHPEDGPPPSDESEMFQNVCDYIDRLVAIARPRKLLFLCLDGVAPRAKMNQQRSRRYKSAQDAAQAEEVWKQVSADWVEQGLAPPTPVTTWDSNVITPGTEFMDRLAYVLRFYVAQRMAESTYWRNLTVLVSDSNVPGEGEHKIMALVREMRGKISPNTVHCIHGMDADLIMLGLSTHEAHFYIMREAVTSSSDRRGVIRVPASASSGSIKTNANFRSGWKPMQFLQIPVLREYLAHEFSFPPEELVSQDPQTGALFSASSNLERHIDDFIFMCFFVGNDFLPHLPSLSLQKGSIDLMMILYKNLFPKLCRKSDDPYLTNSSGFVNVANVYTFSEYLAKAEPAIFQDDVVRKEQDARRAATNARNNESNNRKRPITEVSLVVERPTNKFQKVDHDLISEFSVASEPSRGSVPPAILPAPKTASDPNFAAAIREKTNKLTLEFHQTQADHKDLGQGSLEEYRKRYYTSKFGVSSDEVEDIAAQAARQYVKGMQWVLLCYRRGVPSWSWFYPYHFAPLAMDIHNYGFQQLPRSKIMLSPFTLGSPVKPLDQLMSVLPPRSSSFLPKEFAKLMIEPSSPLIDCYPVKFHSDCNGKKQSWQWVALLPFIDLPRLLYWTHKSEASLNEEERRRNRRGFEYLFVSPDNSLYKQISHSTPSTSPSAAEGDRTTTSADGLASTVTVIHSAICGEVQMLDLTSDGTSPIPINEISKACSIRESGFQDFTMQCKICKFTRPQLTNAEAELLPGATPPQKTLTQSDLDILTTTQHKGRGPFNINVATRIILSVIGGKVYREYLSQQNQIRAQQEAERMNAASIVDISNQTRLPWQPRSSPQHPPVQRQGGPPPGNRQRGDHAPSRGRGGGYSSRPNPPPPPHTTAAGAPKALNRFFGPPEQYQHTQRPVYKR